MTATRAAQALVLLVDDDDDSRFLYAHFLSSVAGYRVVEAADGRAAIESARALIPDLIVMDLSLPVIDGRDAARAIRADERTRSIPILALSGFSQMASGTDGNGDFTAFLTKPCMPDQLAQAIQAALGA